jgi:hypothetical protein
MTRIIGDYEERAASGARFEFGILDGMAASAAESWRAGPTMTVVRGVQNLFDTSDEIDPVKANIEFGLEGTEYAFKDGEKVTVDRAKAVADDMYDLRMNELITETVNEDSPFLGRLTQFVGAVGAGVIDPVMIAGNIGVSAGMASLVRSKNIFNAISKMNKGSARLLHNMYDNSVSRNLTQIMAREGTEGLATGILEESMHFVGIGDDRIARKITTAESLINITAGTVFGSLAGTAMSKDGRKALAHKFFHNYGDDAPNFLNPKLASWHAEGRLSKESGFVERMNDRDAYGSRPWHEVSYVNNDLDTHTGTKYFIPIDEDGNAHMPSVRGTGTVLTDNFTYAQNKGKAYIEVDADNLRIMNRDDFNASKVEMVDTIVPNLTKLGKDENIASALSELTGKEIPANSVAIEKELKEVLSKVESLDDFVDLYHRLSHLSEISDNPNKAIDMFLDAKGFDGYMFNGKNFSNEKAYNGLYVKETSAQRLKKGETKAPKEPNPDQIFAWRNEEASMYAEYGRWVKDNAFVEKAARIADSGLAPEKEAQLLSGSNEELQSIMTSKQFREGIEKIKSNAERKVAEGTPISDEEKMVIDFMDKMSSAKDLDEFTAKEADNIAKYIECEIG